MSRNAKVSDTTVNLLRKPINRGDIGVCPNGRVDKVDFIKARTSLDEYL
jgi:hypothetical protein